MQWRYDGCPDIRHSARSAESDHCTRRKHPSFKGKLEIIKQPQHKHTTHALYKQCHQLHLSLYAHGAGGGLNGFWDVQ